MASVVAVTGTVAAEAPVGELLRQWRQRRRLSQLDLAGEAGVSARHLSFVETGRAQPSRDMLLRLARTRVGSRLLGVPQRVLEMVFLVALVLAGVLAVVFEQWILLIVVVILLAFSGVEELRRRTAKRSKPSVSSRRTSADSALRASGRSMVSQATRRTTS